MERKEKMKGRAVAKDKVRERETKISETRMSKREMKEI